MFGLISLTEWIYTETLSEPGYTPISNNSLDTVCRLFEEYQRKLVQLQASGITTQLVPCILYAGSSDSQQDCVCTEDQLVLGDITVVQYEQDIVGYASQGSWCDFPPIGLRCPCSPCQ